MHDLATLTVLDLQGRSVAVSDLWKDRPVLLVFLRHYG